MTHFPALPRTWTLDGTSWNTGPDGDGNSLLVQSVTGWDASLPPRPDIAARTNASGAYRGPNYRGPRIVEIRGKAEATSPQARQALKDRLTALCPDPDTLYPLVETEFGRSLTLWVELNDTVDATPRPDGLTLDVNLQLIAPDGVKYTADHAPVSTGLATPADGGVAWNGTPSVTGGTEWNGVLPVTGGLVYQSGAGEGGVLQLTNAGTADAPIMFTITPAGSVTNPVITNKTTSQRIAYTGVLADALTIDTGTGRVTIGDINVGGALSDADFFYVPAGSSLEVLFTASGGAAVLTAVNADAYA